jgi:hypothetical protein
MELLCWWCATVTWGLMQTAPCGKGGFLNATAEELISKAAPVSYRFMTSHKIEAAALARLQRCLKRLAADLKPEFFIQLSDKFISHCAQLHS